MTDVDCDPESALPLSAERFKLLGWKFTHSDPGDPGGDLDEDQLRVGREVRRGQRAPLFIAQKRGRGDVLVEQRSTTVQGLFDAIHEYERHQR